MSILIDGKKTAEKIHNELLETVKQLKKENCQPKLTVILVGDDPASKVYVGHKQKACDKVGIVSETLLLPEDTTQDELLSKLKVLNRDKSVHGILVQLPLPDQISENKIIEAIVPDKDVDGFHPVNRGKLVSGENVFQPCTPAGIQYLLKEYHINPSGQHVVIVGRSNIVGKPLAVMMMQKKEWAIATVTTCHTGSADLERYTSQADILVSAVGRPGTITSDMVKDGAVVIDVGTNRVKDETRKSGYRLCGDVDFEAVQSKVSAITPVPGGVGPMTIAMLLKNTVDSAIQHNK